MNDPAYIQQNYDLPPQSIQFSRTIEINPATQQELIVLRKGIPIVYKIDQKSVVTGKCNPTSKNY